MKGALRTLLMDTRISLMLSSTAGGAQTTTIPLVRLLVFGSAKLLAEVCERFHQPGLVGEILAGLLLGLSVLGWVAPDEVMAAPAPLLSLAGFLKRRWAHGDFFVGAVDSLHQ